MFLSIANTIFPKENYMYYAYSSKLEELHKCSKSALMVWNKWFSNSSKDRGNGGMQTITGQQTAPRSLFHTSEKARES